MIDINELRQSAQAATPGPWYIGSGTYEGRNIYSVEAVTDDEGFTYNPVVATAEDDDVVCWEANARLIAAANPAVISELLDRLEAAEADALEQARLNGMGASREAALIAKLEAAERERDWHAERCEDAMNECDALRAKIEAMEKQEPAGYGVRYVEPANGEEDWDSIWMHRVFAEDHIKDFTQAYVDIGEPVGAITVVPLYALPGAQGEEK